MEYKKMLTPYNYTAMKNKENRYIVVHYVGAESSAVSNAKYLRDNSTSASAHYFVDETEIWQCVEDKNKAWHCGGGLQGTGGHTFYGKCTNANSIGIEMCCKIAPSGVWYFEYKTVENAAELIRHLMNKHNIPIDRVIRHYDVTGKICPAPYVDDIEWAKFKSKVTGGNAMTIEEQKKFNALVEQVDKLTREKKRVYHYTEELPGWARPTIQKLLDAEIYAGAAEDDLDLSETLMRVLVINDRAGLYKGV